MTFTVTDALLSPLGLSILTGAGLEDKKPQHVHVTYDVAIDENGTGKISYESLAAELHTAAETLIVCDDEVVRPYATVLDHNGAIIDWVDEVKFTGSTASTTEKKAYDVKEGQDLVVVPTDVTSKTIKLDFYVLMKTGVTKITVKPDDFGGFFYVEADTLYRNQDGKDMAATITFPKVKVQSGFSIAMSPNGDPSTFDFNMDAMPGYTYFDKEHKVVCDFTILGDDNGAVNSDHFHSVPTAHEGV